MSCSASNEFQIIVDEHSSSLCSTIPLTDERISIKTVSSNYQLQIRYVVQRGRFSCSVIGIGSGRLAKNTTFVHASDTDVTTAQPMERVAVTNVRPSSSTSFRVTTRSNTSSTTSTNSIGCGTVENTKIIDGQEASEHEYPWMTYLRLGNVYGGLSGNKMNNQ